MEVYEGYFKRREENKNTNIMWLSHGKDWQMIKRLNSFYNLNVYTAGNDPSYIDNHPLNNCGLPLNLDIIVWYSNNGFFKENFDKLMQYANNISQELNKEVVGVYYANIPTNDPYRIGKILIKSTLEEDTININCDSAINSLPTYLLNIATKYYDDYRYVHSVKQRLIMQNKELEGEII